MELAKMVTDMAAKDFKPRARVLIALPGPNVTSDEAARQILTIFLARAFRRPATAAQIKPYLELYAPPKSVGRRSSSPSSLAARCPGLADVSLPRRSHRIRLPRNGRSISMRSLRAFRTFCGAACRTSCCSILRRTES
jgi:hypothetical protein